MREDGRIWAYGYDTDNAKCRCWYDAMMPLLYMEGDLAPIYSANVASMVKTARYVSGLVLSAVFKATMLHPKKDEQKIVWKWPKDVLNKLKRAPTERSEIIETRVNASGEELESRVESGLLTRPLAARADFWTSSEERFFKRAAEMRTALLAGTDESEILRRWRDDMIQTARRVFRNHTQVGDFDASDPRRSALAQMELDKKLNGQWLNDLLGRLKNQNRKEGNNEQSS
jgi:hypothetical protein